LLFRSPSPFPSPPTSGERAGVRGIFSQLLRTRDRKEMRNGNKKIGNPAIPRQARDPWLSVLRSPGVWVYPSLFPAIFSAIIVPTFRIYSVFYKPMNFNKISGICLFRKWRSHLDIGKILNFFKERY
jgi:hypothetical protein